METIKRVKQDKPKAGFCFCEKDEKKIARVTEAFLKMKKFDLAKLQEAATQG